MGLGQLVQWVWVYRRAVDLDGLERFHHNLGHGLLGRRIERSPLPFGRHRWVTSAQAPAIDVAERARPRAELSDWADERAQLPIDPERGPGWHLGVLPLTDGATAVSLVASHCLVDGLGCALAIADAVKGDTRDLGYPPPRSRTRVRAVVADAGQTLHGLPEVARAALAVVKLARSQRQDFARFGGSRPGGDAAGEADEVVVPAIAIHIGLDEWDARAKELGGTSNSLFTAFAAKLGERMGRRCTDDSPIRVIITASDRTAGDTRANALSFTSIDVDTTTVTTDLAGVRAGIKGALTALRETPDESLQTLPLTPLTPKRAVRRLADVLFAFPDLPVTCTNIGDVDPVVGRPDGTDADHVFARGVDQRVMRRILGQKFFLGSGRIGDTIFITVVAYHLNGSNSKPDLRELAAHTLAEFDLTGEID